MTQKKVSRWVAILIVGIILTACISLTQGELSVSFMDLKALLLGQGSQAKQLLVWDFRLPRIVLAVLAGAALGLSGAILQGITRNPLADTGILGINWRLASGCWDFSNRVSSSFRIDASSNGLSGCHFEYGYFSTHLINYIKN